MDPTIRPANGVLLIAMQSAEGAAATLDPTLHAVPYEGGSISYGSPYTTEQSTEVTGSLVGGAPLVIGQAAAFGFRSRLKGAGAGQTYTSTLKPPLHAALQGCGMRGQFMAAVAATALTAGSTTSATLATPFSATAQSYVGMPLILTGGVGAGQMPLVTGFTSGRVATLSDLMPGALTTGTSAALPANWTYAGTSPADNTARLTDQPCVTIGYYEDGLYKWWMDCRGSVDLEGASARPGIGSFSFNGVYMGETDVSVPANAVVAGHSAPTLVQGLGLPPAINANRKPLPISRWSLGNGGAIENPDDPNTPFGYGSGQIGGRVPVFECDPLKTLVATRNAIAEIASFTQYPVALKFGTSTGNRVSIVAPLAQIIDAAPGDRGSLRSETLRFQCLNGGDDAYARDTERVICFF